jgi:SAM-dependent methyltransferase
VETVTYSPALLALLVLICAVAVFIVHAVFKRLRATPAMRRLEFPVEELGGFSYRQLVLVSFLGMFTEMLMIRWVSSEIRIFAYFKNFVLVACFLGFGRGCYLCRHPIQLRAIIAPLLLLTALLSPLPLLRRAIAGLPQLLGGGVEVHVWGVPAAPASWGGMFLAIAVVVPLFAVIATTFIPFGQLVGWYLENAPNGVAAYSVNVLAGLAGIAAFTLLCFLYQPPWVWFLVAGIFSLLVFWRNPAGRMALGATFLACVALLAIPDRGATTYWSPYQKLVVQPLYRNGELEAYSLATNDSFYQMVINLSPAFVQSHPEQFRRFPLEWNSYNMPYRFYPAPPSVLVLGSGMGNDVAAALRNGANRVVAVEIDPLILRLGRELHFEHPYDSPRTHVVLNDARSYIENSHEQFDLIVFSLLDSHTTTSHFTNIRIDNYVYTREALQRARRLLKPDGLFIVKFQVDTPWIAGRLFGLMKDAFGQDPIQFQSDVGGYDTAGRFFVDGSRERLAQAAADPALAAYLASSHSRMPMQNASLTTDDWPYFYQHEPGLPISVILISLAVLIICGRFLLQTGAERGGGELHFLFLGAGFMLLEAQIVSKMALLFGTTWVVNAIVVSGLLCLIVAANLVYSSWPRLPVSLAYACLFLSLAAMFAVPLEKLFVQSWLMRAMVATLALCLPVFFAGIIFVSSFARVGFRGSALGSNLFGALLGGLLESFSLWFGLRSLTILAAVLYVASAIFIHRAETVTSAASAAPQIDSA